MAEFERYQIEILCGAVFILLLLFLLALRFRRHSKPEKIEEISKGEVPSATVQQGVQQRQEPVEHQLKSTSQRLFGALRSMFGGKTAEREELFRSLEESLIGGDVGVKTTDVLIRELRDSIPKKVITLQEVEELLKEKMRAIFNESDGSAINLTPPLTVIALVGVNGVGKTTTAGKLAYQFAAAGHKVVLGACDTFRAAASEQLKLWAERSSAEIVEGSEGVKSSTVAYNALKKAQANGSDILILDTAGRLHTKGNLMQELQALLSLVSRECPGAPHEIILVVDSTNGQNALEQARAFHAVTPLTGIIVTKLDGTPRGGMLFAIRKEIGTPVRYIGLGEKPEQLKRFDPDQFLDELFEPTSQEEVQLLEPKRRRRNGGA